MDEYPPPLPDSHSVLRHLTFGAGETDVRPDSTAAEGSFLERERAVLGEDAELFAANDKPGAATVEDGGGDLLGEDGDFTSAPAQQSGEPQKDLDDFESSFPAIDTQNDVGVLLVSSTNSIDP